MSERQIVRLVIRTMGLLGILYVVRHWAVIYHRTGTIHMFRGEWWKLIAEICLVLIGLYMIAGAPLLLRLVTDKDSDNNSKS
jgi:hypothetical protein